MNEIARKSGFSVMTEDELYSVNGGDTYPATLYTCGDEKAVVADGGSHGTVYEGSKNDGECFFPDSPGQHGQYDTDTGTFTTDGGKEITVKADKTQKTTTTSTASNPTPSGGPTGSGK